MEDEACHICTGRDPGGGGAVRGREENEKLVEMLEQWQQEA